SRRSSTRSSPRACSSTRFNRAAGRAQPAGGDQSRLLGLELRALAQRRLLPPRCPAGRWLAFYAERFDTVEVNATFYRLPRRDAVARWTDETPDGFLFAV